MDSLLIPVVLDRATYSLSDVNSQDGENEDITSSRWAIRTTDTYLKLGQHLVLQVPDIVEQLDLE